MTIHAYTEPSGPNPAYVNISERPDIKGQAIITVRSTGDSFGRRMTLSRDQAVALAHDILRHYGAPTPDVKAAVDRFLGWKLPQDFAPDAGISFMPSTHPLGWPVGTNLLSADQAKAMFEHALAGVACANEPKTATSYLQPHQQRVVDERAELDERLAKLSAFIDGATFRTLDADEQNRLEQQAAVMATYSDILTERIAAFMPAAAA